MNLANEYRWHSRMMLALAVIMLAMTALAAARAATALGPGACAVYIGIAAICAMASLALLQFWRMFRNDAAEEETKSAPPESPEPRAIGQR